MISAKEARAYNTSKSKKELEKLDRAILFIANQNETSLTLSTGLTKEAMDRQNEIFPLFEGTLEKETICILKSLGYKINSGSSYQGSWIIISWGEGKE